MQLKYLYFNALQDLGRENLKPPVVRASFFLFQSHFNGYDSLTVFILGWLDLLYAAVIIEDGDVLFLVCRHAAVSI